MGDVAPAVTADEFGDPQQTRLKETDENVPGMCAQREPNADYCWEPIFRREPRRELTPA